MLRQLFLSIIIIAALNHAFASTDTAISPFPISITIGGGVSLGSYQAGYNFYATEWLKKNKSFCKVKIVTGASAGAINALLTVLTIADTAQHADSNSLFYQAWIPIGLKDLKGSKSSTSIFSQDNIKARADKIIRQAFKAATKTSNPPILGAEKLDIVLGISITRATPITETFGSLPIPVIKNDFVVRLQHDSLWQTSNYYFPNSDLLTPILPLGLSTKKNIDVLLKLIYASSCFPMAFQPDSFKHRLVRPAFALRKVSGDSSKLGAHRGKEWAFLDSCIKDTVNKTYIDGSGALLLDGGVTDNSPIHLAYNLGKHGLIETASNIDWSDLPNDTMAQPISRKMVYMYFDKDHSVFPQPKPVFSEADSSFLSSSRTILSSFLTCASSAELYSLRREYKVNDSSFAFTKNYSPKMSSYMMNFFGFFDRSFREYDYYLGKYDARHYFVEEFIPMLCKSKGIPIDSIQYPVEDTTNIYYQSIKTVFDTILKKEREFATTPSADIDTNIWEPLISTVNRLYAPTPEVKVKCGELKEGCPDCQKETKKYRQHAILLQTSVDRLWATWIIALRSKGKWAFDEKNGTVWERWKNIRPVFFNLPKIDTNLFNKYVVNAYDLDNRKNGKSESDLDGLFYLLKEYGFEYSDLDSLHDWWNKGNVKTNIAKEFSGLILDLAKRQKSAGDKFLFRAAATPLANNFQYNPAQFSYRLSLGFNGIEFGPTLHLYKPLSWEFFGTIEKGTKHHLMQEKWWQWVPSPLFTTGPRLDLTGIGFVDYLRPRLSIGSVIGKDWQYNRANWDEWVWGWNICPFDITFKDFFEIRFSWMPIIPLKTSTSPFRSLWMGHPNDDIRLNGKWDYFRFDLQLGIQMLNTGIFN